MDIDRNMKILVVDDSTTMRNLIKGILRKLGYMKLYDADDGETGWQSLQDGDIEFVISDWNMPKMTGLDFLRKVRESEKFKQLPFLMVTAECMKDNVIEAIKAGVSGYIVKPFSPQALQDRMVKICTAHKPQMAK